MSAFNIRTTDAKQAQAEVEAKEAAEAVEAPLVEEAAYQPPVGLPPAYEAPR